MSDSQSSSVQTTAQTDNRRVIGQGGISAEGSNVSVVNNTLDASVATTAITASTSDLAAALNYSDLVTGRAADVAQSALDSAFSFGTKAQARVADSLNTEAQVLNTAYADAKGRGALTDKILIGAIAMAGLVALAAVRGHKA